MTNDGKLAFLGDGSVVDVKTHKVITVLKDENGRRLHTVEKDLFLAFQDGKLLETNNQFAGRRSQGFCGARHVQAGSRISLFEPRPSTSAGVCLPILAHDQQNAEIHDGAENSRMDNRRLCRGEASGAVAVPPPRLPGPFTQDQVDAGRQDFMTGCASCHGNNFVRRNRAMPFHGSILQRVGAEAHYRRPLHLHQDHDALLRGRHPHQRHFSTNIVAFILSKNGAKAGSETFTAATSVKISDIVPPAR